MNSHLNIVQKTARKNMKLNLYSSEYIEKLRLRDF